MRHSPVVYFFLLSTALISVSCKEEEVIPNPVIRSLNVHVGIEGVTEVIITGENFSASTSELVVKFNTTIAPVSSASLTELKVIVPPGATSGPVSVMVRKKTATGPSFTIIPKLIFTSVSASSGIEGSSVTIVGSGFSPDPLLNEVFFAGTTATVTSASSTQIVVTVPEASTGAISIHANDQQVTGAIFTVIEKLTLINVAPDIGVAHKLVTLKGRGFNTTSNLNTVKFNGIEALVKSATTTELVVSVPSEATTGLITINANTQEVTGPVFTVPVGISSITPTIGPVGTVVTINGFGFSPTKAFNSVSIGQKLATILEASSTQLVVKIPLDAEPGAGTIQVSVNDQFDVLGPEFTVDHTPTIIDIDPTTAPIGSMVIINGTSFSEIPEQNIVSFNGTLASIMEATPTKLVVEVLPGTTTGPISITVNGTKIMGPIFTVIGPPVVTSLEPSSGPVGTVVKIKGEKFSTNIGGNYIKFNGNVYMATNVSATEIHFTIPDETVTGSISVLSNSQWTEGPVFTVLIPEADLTVDGVQRHFTLSASGGSPPSTPFGVGGFSPPDCSIGITFSAKPTTNGTYTIKIYTVWLSQEYDQPSASVNVTINGNKMVISLTNVVLNPLNLGPAKQMSGTILVYL